MNSKLDEEEIKNFLQTHPKTNFMQSPEWAKVKKSDRSHVVL